MDILELLSLSSSHKVNPELVQRCKIKYRDYSEEKLRKIVKATTTHHASQPAARST